MGAPGDVQSSTRNNFISDFRPAAPVRPTCSFVMRTRVTLAIPCLITSLTLNRRDIAIYDVHFSAKLVKSIGNIKCRHITFSEI
jgi:hypothetical protein